MRMFGFLAAALVMFSIPVSPGPAIASEPSAAERMVPLPAALRGDYFTLKSDNVRRVFQIYVRYPEGYDADTERHYPVVYMLDGDSIFPMLAPTHQFLTYDEKLPEALIIGIAYGGFDASVNKRNVDFNFAAPEVKTGEDGAAAFLAFLKQELIPDIERRYRADPNRRILVGQSLGGNFVLWSAYKDPDLFWGRIASNATSRRWFFDNRPSTSLKADLAVVLASGTRDRPVSREYAVRYATHMSTQTGLPWAFHPITIEGGTHAADIAQVYSDAMLWLFDPARGTRE